MIIATVEHVQSGELLSGDVTLVAYSPTARDSVTYALSGSSSATLTLFESPLSGGVYTVEIRLPGYQTWRREGVVVHEEAQCHHTLVTPLSAVLVPL